MSNPNVVNLNNLDSRYATMANITSAITAQAATDAGQYAPSISVSAYGAVGNGTIDSTAAIQNAINAAASQSSSVSNFGVTTRVTATQGGKYKISAITIPSGVTVDWTGADLVSTLSIGYAVTFTGSFSQLINCSLFGTGTTVSLTSSGTTSGSPVVTSSAITTVMQGFYVVGSGIPSGSYVGTVTAGTSFRLSSSPTTQTDVNATSTATITATGYSSGGGVNFATGSYTNHVQNSRFNFFYGRAIYDQAIANAVSHVLAENCLLAANALPVPMGVYEMAGTDGWATNCELTASRFSANGMSASGNAYAFAITGANNMARDIVAETSDHGVYLGGGATQCHLSGVRGELCYGNGFTITGGSGRMEGCHALRNSQSGNNLYSGFNATGGNWVTSSLYSESGSGSPTQNYGIVDTQVSQSSFNIWGSLKSSGDSQPMFQANSTSTRWVLPNAGVARVSGSPYAHNITRNTMTNTSVTSVSSFSGGVNGQEQILIGDGFTTITPSAGLKTASGSNLFLNSGSFYRFMKQEGVWYQQDLIALNGTATLSGGSVVISLTTITANARVRVGIQTPGGTVGAPFVSALTAGTGFTISSTSSSDTSTVWYEIKSH